MPELPEVETIARGVDERLRGDRIETAWFSEKPEPFKSSPQLMATELPGRRIDRDRLLCTGIGRDPDCVVRTWVARFAHRAALLRVCRIGPDGPVETLLTYPIRGTHFQATVRHLKSLTRIARQTLLSMGMTSNKRVCKRTPFRWSRRSSWRRRSGWFDYPGDPGGSIKRHPRPACPITATNWRKIEGLRDTGLTRIGLSLARRTSVRYTDVPPQRSCFPSQ